MTRTDGSVEDYAYNALGALRVNAGAILDHQRPRLDGSGNADAAVPATLAGQPVTLDRGGRVTSVRGVTFDFTNAGYLIDASDGSRFAIDLQHRRAWQRAEHGLEAFVHEGANLVGVIHHSGAPFNADTVDEQWLYDGVDHPLRLTTTTRTLVAKSSVVYFELDLAGNIRRVRGAHGEDYGGYRYTAFGKTVEDTATATLAALPVAVTQRLRWKARPLQHFGGTEVYDMRARQWVPELGSFLSVDEYRYHSTRTTLWGWPGQNPIRWRDVSGHDTAQMLPYGQWTRTLYHEGDTAASSAHALASNGEYVGATVSGAAAGIFYGLGALSSLLPLMPAPTPIEAGFPSGAGAGAAPLVEAPTNNIGMMAKASGEGAAQCVETLEASGGVPKHGPINRAYHVAESLPNGMIRDRTLRGNLQAYGADVSDIPPGTTDFSPEDHARFEGRLPPNPGEPGISDPNFDNFKNKNQ